MRYIEQANAPHSSVKKCPRKADPKRGNGFFLWKISNIKTNIETCRFYGLNGYAKLRKFYAKTQKHLQVKTSNFYNVSAI